MLFLDDDMGLCRDWLAPAMNLLDQSPEVAAVTGAVVNVFPNGETEVCGALLRRHSFMCGIAGVVDARMSPTAIREAVQRMTDSIVHRAVLTGRASSFADGIGLGARRLSIIHVAGGIQPTANEDHRIQVLMNR